MSLSTAEVLAPQVILDRISRLEFPGTSLSRFFGFPLSEFAGLQLETMGMTRPEGTPGRPGAYMRDSPTRSGSYDIMDITRRVATGRVPGTEPSMQPPRVYGTVPYTIPRSAESIEVTYEQLNQQRPSGESVTTLDTNGARFINDQEQYLAQRFANILEFQAAGLMRGGWYYTQRGNDLEQSFTAGDIFIDMKLPASNLNQLNLTGDGNLIGASWTDPTTDIPGQILAINSAMVQTTGVGLRHIFLRSATWNSIVNNNYVKAQAGTAMRPYTVLEQVDSGEFTATIPACPWVQFHIVDYGLELWNGTTYVWTPMIEADHVGFFPDPSPTWLEYLRGMETVVEGPNGPKSNRYGFYLYGYETHEPAGHRVSAVFNGMPMLKRVKAFSYADITP